MNYTNTCLAWELSLATTSQLSCVGAPQLLYCLARELSLATAFLLSEPNGYASGMHMPTSALHSHLGNDRNAPSPQVLVLNLTSLGSRHAEVQARLLFLFLLCSDF